VNLEKLRERRNRQAILWSDKEMAVLTAGVEADLTWLEIAMRLGRSSEAVRTKAVSAGIHVPISRPRSRRSARKYSDAFGD
jgi:hypothetical protein